MEQSPLTNENNQTNINEVEDINLFCVIIKDLNGYYIRHDVSEEILTIRYPTISFIRSEPSC